MSEDLTAIKTTGGTTGSLCSRTGLYRATDGKIVSVLLIKKGDTFPPFVGASGTTKTTWYAVTDRDSTKSSFESVTVAAGTV
ncbi:MAG TPA: hypothetical protein VHH35_21135 [Pyrinomonadaceae bacterium]|nr:hypothetical protein [Pyrinomonadaceae bacterium]